MNIELAKKLFISEIPTINGIYLLWDNKKIISKDIQIIFKEGKPFLVKAILLFKNSLEWFNFLNFMNIYSKETGLFLETNFYINRLKK